MKLRIALALALLLASAGHDVVVAFGDPKRPSDKKKGVGAALTVSTTTKPSPPARARPPTTPTPPASSLPRSDSTTPSDSTSDSTTTTPGATCWSRDCSAAFPERACETVGSLSVECDALIDAGVAYRTREQCCRRTFGPAGCGTGCYVPKEEEQQQNQQQSLQSTPNRECTLLTEPARCLARRRARLPAFASEPECCAAVYGGPCMRFPERCYASDPEWPGQCIAVEGASECAALYWSARQKALASGVPIGREGTRGHGGGGGLGLATAADDYDDDADDNRKPTTTTTTTTDLGFSLTRDRCCRANGYDRASCAQTVECYEADHRALPTRRCVATESPRCLERMAAGLAYSTRAECCATAFGRGRGCREFPAVCYKFDPARQLTPSGDPLRPFDACPRVEGASVGKCALLLEQDSAAAQEAAETIRQAKEEAARKRRAMVAAKERSDGGGGSTSSSTTSLPGDAPLPAFFAPLTTARVFEQRVDCCAAALPLGWVDFDSPDLERGCPYAPASCWAPVRAPERARRPGVVPAGGDDLLLFCLPLKDRPAECSRRVSDGTAWPTQDECCRGVGGCASWAAQARGGGMTVRITRGPATPRAFEAERRQQQEQEEQRRQQEEQQQQQQQQQRPKVAAALVAAEEAPGGASGGGGVGGGGSSWQGARRAGGGGDVDVAAPPRRARTEREIATQPASAGPWVPPRSQAAATAAGAQHLPAQGRQPPPAQKRVGRQQQPASAAKTGGFWDDSTASSSSSSSQPRRTAAATPVQQAPAAPAPPPTPRGPAPVAAAPFAGPVFYASGGPK